MTMQSRLRTALVACVSVVAIVAASPAQAAETRPAAAKQQQQQAATYEQAEIVSAVADFFGITAEAAGEAVERIFRDNGRPTGYVRGEEAAAAIGVGVRYGEGTLQLKNGQTRKVFWQGPSIGFDTGANASKVFTLVYGLGDADRIYQRFPGVEGSAYLVGGVGVNYQRADNVTLAPMRAGVGLRAGANIGYLAYTRERSLLPL
ncbi:MAG: DUF1134 domain-containing protein [Hyphomonadaceae bacterium]|nr:DUF1134 domain-containing protein [Hyphomonadaceae bacterium]